jgi:hypothetical protein
MAATRPTEPFAVGVRYVRSTSIRDIESVATIFGLGRGSPVEQPIRELKGCS